MGSEFLIKQIESMSLHRLLIISCSRRKRLTAQSVPAIERYDGPLFQVLRKFQANSPKQVEKLDVYILSGKFGLMPASKKIPLYDQPMTAQRADELNPQFVAEICKIFASKRYKEVFVCVGKEYLRALKGYESYFPRKSVVTKATGSLGRRQTSLRQWLYGEAAPALELTPSGIAFLRGKEITLTPNEVIAIASRALAENKGEPHRYQSWYVPINGDRVAPKWLVSLLSDLPVGEFHSDEARRVLQQLSIKVYPA